MTTPPSTDPTRPTPPRDERSAVRQTLATMKEGGWVITDMEYSDGELFGSAEVQTLDLDDLIYEIFSVDDVFVHFRKDERHKDDITRETGWVYFVFGNDPEEVVCNTSTSLSETLDPLFEKWSGR